MIEFENARREVMRIAVETLVAENDVLTEETSLGLNFDTDDLSFSFCPEVERFFGFRIANTDWEKAETINDVARLVVEYSKRPRKRIEKPKGFWPRVKYYWLSFVDPGRPDFE